MLLKKLNMAELTNHILEVPTGQVIRAYTDTQKSSYFECMTIDAFNAKICVLCSQDTTCCRACHANPKNLHFALGEITSDIRALPEYYVEEAARPDTYPCLVTLVRYREEGFNRETYVDTFLVNVPISVERHQLEGYAEQQLRAAAHNLLVGETGDEAMRMSCGDFNWGDFVASFEEDKELGVSSKLSIRESANSVQNVTVTVNQDEQLFDESIDAVLIIRKPDGSIESTLATVNMAYGNVTPAAENFSCAEGDTFAIDFGNAVLHSVAASQSGQDESHYYWLDLG